MRRNLAATLVCFLTGTAFADGLPDLTIPSGVGVNIHFISGHEQDLTMISAAGFKWVRQDFFWDRIERQKGQYDWSEFDAFTTALERHGLRPYYILDYSNPLYEKTVISTNPVTGKPEQHTTASPQQPDSWLPLQSGRPPRRNIFADVELFGRFGTNRIFHSGNQNPTPRNTLPWPSPPPGPSARRTLTRASWRRPLPAFHGISSKLC